MRFRLVLILGFVAIGGCGISVPNGLFGCGQPSDCPSGYFCWSSDSRCYDTKEPECVPKTCDEVIDDFASLGIPIECGSLPDECDGSLECGACPAGTICGANGQNFVCGCEENSCSSYGGGAECGIVPSHCGGGGETIFCGTCFGERVCVENKCICPLGPNCDGGCDGGEPSYPCTMNECSPPGGLPDGCGGVAHCPPCANGEDCVLSDDVVFECLGDCTCKAQGIQCGNATVCGAPTLCGTCADNGFEGGYRCESGRCVCEDSFEYNDTFDTFTLICGEGTSPNCTQTVWSVDVQATLHDAEDVDYYALRVLDAPTPILAQASGGLSSRTLYLSYLCPDGSEGIDACSGSTNGIQDVKFCISQGDTIAIERKCDSNLSAGTGTVLVGVEAGAYRGACDPYGLKILATYATEIPGID